MKVLMIRIGWAMPGRAIDQINGVDYYRMVLPAEFINKNSDIQVDIKGDMSANGTLSAETMWDNIFVKGGYDLMVVKNIDSFNGVAQLIGARDSFKKKVIVDLDDNLNSVDPSSPVYDKYYPDSDSTIATNSLIGWSDDLWVENEQLYYEYRSLKYAQVLPNYIDRRSLDLNVRERKSDKIKIGWLGGATHKIDVESIFPVLKKVFDKYPNTEFVMMGGDCINSDLLPKDRINLVPFKLDYNDYLKSLGQLDINIGIIPLVESKFNNCKSPCKYFEYTIGGIPTIATGGKDLPYKRVVKHGDTGLLYKNNEELFEQLCELIENERMRKELVENARDDLRTNWCMQDHWDKWVKALERCK